MPAGPAWPGPAQPSPASQDQGQGAAERVGLGGGSENQHLGGEGWGDGSSGGQCPGWEPKT